MFVTGKISILIESLNYNSFRRYILTTELLKQIFIEIDTLAYCKYLYNRKQIREQQKRENDKEKNV